MKSNYCFIHRYNYLFFFVCYVSPNQPKNLHFEAAIPHCSKTFISALIIVHARNATRGEFTHGCQIQEKVAFVRRKVFDTTGSQWSTLSDTPEVCSVGAAVTLNDFIYVVGGHNCRCLKYDPALDYWTKLNRPSQGHSNAQAVVWRGSIQVVGGEGAKAESSVIE